MTYHVEAGDGEGGGAGHDGGRLSTTCRETRLHSAVSTNVTPTRNTLITPHLPPATIGNEFEKYRKYYRENTNLVILSFTNIYK